MMPYTIARKKRRIFDYTALKAKYGHILIGHYIDQYVILYIIVIITTILYSITYTICYDNSSIDIQYIYTRSYIYIYIY